MAGAEVPKFLMLVPNIPRYDGSGAAVRTYHFARALARLGQLYLIILKTEGQAPGSELTRLCRRIICAPNEPLGPSAERPSQSRIQGWVKIIKTVLFPWRENWAHLMCFANASDVGLYSAHSAGKVPRKFSRRLLQAVVRLELDIAASFFRPLPLWSFNLWEGFSSIFKEARSLLHEVRFDAVWVEHAPLFPFASELIRGAPRPFIICNTHNVESNLQNNIEHLGTPLGSSLLARQQTKILERIERDSFSASDLVFVCSTKDQSLAMKLAPSAKVIVAANGVDTSYFRPTPERIRDSNPSILFTGVMDYPPNLDAVKYFAQEIFPIIKTSIEGCRFVVAGRNAAAAFETLGIKDSAIVCVNNPPDMRPFFAKAWVCVVPLRAGGGTRLKILEAMAMGCAVVSTSIGAEGVPYANGQELILADEPQSFALAVTRLVRDPNYRGQLEQRAAEFVRAQYDWNALTATAIQRFCSDPLPA